MNARRLWFSAWALFLCVGCVSVSEALAAAPVRDPSLAIAQTIDEQVTHALRGEKIPVAPRSDDAEFLRRAYLDLVGRIPSVSEARAFLADRRSDRRERLIDRLVNSHAFTNQLAQVFRASWVPQATTNLRTQHLGHSLEAWIARRLREDDSPRYDRLVRALLSAPLEYLEQKSDGPSPSRSTDSAIAFYQAADLKAETVTGNVARLFLGVRLECAQCHDHPFDKWTRKQFWQTAAFFAAVAPPDAGYKPDPLRRVAHDALEKKDYQAILLDGKEPDWSRDEQPRRVFAAWLTSPDNPYFARVAVNRLWAHFFGVGVVDPVDDFGSHNEPSHPALLDALARLFAATRFDLRILARGITRSQAYQRTSRLSHPGQKDPRLYARMNLKGLSAEQLFDSLALATGYREEAPRASRLAFGYEPGSPRAGFMAKFGGGSSRADMQTSILQALSLMNGDWMARQTDPDKGETLKTVLAGPFDSDDERLDVLYLATLSRFPSEAEKRKMLASVERSADRKTGLADVFWALLNSHEFLLNR